MDPAYQPPEVTFHDSFAPRKKFQDRRWLHLLLFLLTVLSTTWVGANQYAGFLLDFRPGVVRVGAWLPFFIRGLWYSGTVLLILGAHEMGHYLACRYYQVDASLPFFIPMISLFGTMGAVIRIREPIRTKAMLFDIGAAGPFGGFIFIVPTLFVGIAMSHVTKLPPTFEGYELGEPLLFKAASWMMWGRIPDGYSLNMHPMAFAAWFGLFVTSLNLFPISQLDGGHISYAVFGRRSSSITIGTICVAVVLIFVESHSWVGYAVAAILWTLFMGPHHPPTMDEHVPLDRGRLWLAAAALVVFVLCFMPAPIEPLQLLGK